MAAEQPKFTVVDGLKHYLQKKGIKAEFFEFSESTMAAQDSSRLMGVPMESIVKTVVFTNGYVPVLAIVQGNRRVSPEKLSNAAGEPIRIAKAREVETMTNFKVGEVPPVGHPSSVKVFVDSPIASMDEVIAGGGSSHTLIKLKASDIVTLSNAKVADVSE